MDFLNNQVHLTRRSNQAGKLPRSQTLNPKLAALTNRYFGIDLEGLDSMSDEQLAAFADMAKDADRWLELIPILEKHFQKIIEGQESREQFYANVQRAATASGKRIDNNILQVFLASKGYDQHLRLMSQKAHNGAARIDADHRSAVDLELKDFQSYLQLVQWKHQRAERKIDQALPRAQAQEQLREEESERKAYRKDLLNHGTQEANQNRQRRGFFGAIGDFFMGR